jgi:hypothetical protein
MDSGTAQDLGISHRHLAIRKQQRLCRAGVEDRSNITAGRALDKTLHRALIEVARRHLVQRWPNEHQRRFGEDTQ